MNSINVSDSSSLSPPPQMGTGGLLVRIKQVAAQQGMLSGAFEASMGLLEGDVLADTDAAVAPSPGKGGERERGRDACGGPEAVLLHYLEASASEWATG